MKIYRFVPDVSSYGHPWRGVSGRWWPGSIDMGRWMSYLHATPSLEERDPEASVYRAPQDMPLSDFPWLSLQLPVMSERAAERLGCHPERKQSWHELAVRLRPIQINDARFFAVQPLFVTRGEPQPFVAELSEGISMPRGEILHYYTLTFEPSRVQGELFTLGPHEPYSELYVTEGFVERVRAAGLSGLDHPELVYDDGPIVPRYSRPDPSQLAEPSWYARELWQLFCERGSMRSYFEDELRDVFQDAQRLGLVPS